jgi:hypothetical protein
LMYLIPVRVFHEQHPDAITASPRGEVWVANAQMPHVRLDPHARRGAGMGLPIASCITTSKQNDLRRTSNDCAVDLALVCESSIHTVTSGSTRQLYEPALRRLREPQRARPRKHLARCNEPRLYSPTPACRPSQKRPSKQVWRKRLMTQRWWRGTPRGSSPCDPSELT